MTSLPEIAIFLTAAVVAVPIAQRIGLGSILGYLAAGVVIGPWGLGLIGQVDEVLHMAEFGVVLLLFVIGLAMQPKRLWLLRKSIVGLGGLQVLLSAAVLGLLVLWSMDMSPAAATLAGLALALSSTAFSIQLLAERGELTSKHGRAAFAILLFQDLAVIPILALLPLLTIGLEAVSVAGAVRETVKVAVVITAMVVGGHYLLRPVFRLVAATRMPEIFTAWALLVVIGTALIMEKTGVSVALGAFVAGVLLADSEYRHQLQANIDPFKDILLGLFFIAVGMSINFGVVSAEPLRIVVWAFGLLLVKALLLYALGRRHGLSPAAARSLAAVLPQGGEFAFVILAAAVGSGLYMQIEADRLVAVVTLSMALTPVLAIATSWVNRRLAVGSVGEFDVPSEPEHPVIIAGFGRFGQIVARMLRAKKIGFTALEINPEQVNFARKFGNKVYYGDPSRLDLLRAAGAEDAKIFVLAIDDVDASLRIARTLVQHFPKIKIYARARNRQHAYQLMDLGITNLQRETFLDSLAMAGDVFRGLGISNSEVDRAMQLFRKHDEGRLYAYHEKTDDEAKMQQLAMRAAEELEEQLAQDEQVHAGDEAK